MAKSPEAHDRLHIEGEGGGYGRVAKGLYLPALLDKTVSDGISLEVRVFLDPHDPAEDPVLLGDDP